MSAFITLPDSRPRRSRVGCGGRGITAGKKGLVDRREVWRWRVGPSPGSLQPRNTGLPVDTCGQGDRPSLHYTAIPSPQCTGMPSRYSPPVLASKQRALCGALCSDVQWARISEESAIPSACRVAHPPPAPPHTSLYHSEPPQHSSPQEFGSAQESTATHSQD